MSEEPSARRVAPLLVCTILGLGVSCDRTQTGGGAGDAGAVSGQRQTCSQRSSGGTGLGQINVCVSTQSGVTGGSSVLMDSASSGGSGRLRFTSTRPWRLDAAWSCAEPGATFGLAIRRPDGTVVRRISGEGDGQVSVDCSEEGEFHLDIDSSCSWHVTVAG